MSVNVIELSDLREAVVIGSHPDFPEINVIVLGTEGGDDAWDAACGIVNAYAAAGADMDVFKALIVDAATAQVRPAEEVRRR